MNIFQQLMLPQYLNSGLETLLNKLIQQTEYSENYLRKLNGKIFGIHFYHIDLSVYFVFSLTRVDLLSQYEGEVDCEIHLSPTLLLSLPKKSQLSQLINDKSILLQGDLQVLQDVVALLEFVEKDPVQILSPYVGDVIAYSAVNFLRNLLKLFKFKYRQSQQYWGERLTEEWQVLSPSLAIADFCDQVRQLEEDTARLEQKLAQVRTHH